mmetsp:Transcript_88743/g.254115  ORF Transcript_88743/g.254115 Transcript_88743/m.254115 type:complete len:213 (-) Transcript_88743:250-888(-)
MLWSRSSMLLHCTGGSEPREPDHPSHGQAASGQAPLPRRRTTGPVAAAAVAAAPRMRGRRWAASGGRPRGALFGSRWRWRTRSSSAKPTSSRRRRCCRPGPPWWPRTLWLRRPLSTMPAPRPLCRRHCATAPAAVACRRPRRPLRPLRQRSRRLGPGRSGVGGRRTWRAYRPSRCTCPWIDHSAPSRCRPSRASCWRAVGVAGLPIGAKLGV